MVDIPKKLIRQVISGAVVPFVGAGFSRYYGYPSWAELLKKTAKAIGVNDLNPKDIDRGDPLQISQSLLQFYKVEKYESRKEAFIKELEISATEGQENGLNELLSKILEREIQVRLEHDFSSIVLKEVRINEDRIDHDAIKKLNRLGDLNFNHILTTNYEGVLDNLFPKHKVLSPGTGKELSWNDDERSIIKIHGEKDSPEGIIFTHSQFYNFIHDFGYFRSKLYTLFSSNVVLMMGYGFNDLTIHQTYFQFIRDYSDELMGDKFYMVLTEYDKTKWGSYYDYYVRYLNSYKIIVIETVDLPSFIDELVQEVEFEKDNTSLSSLLEYQDAASTDFTQALLSAVKRESKDWFISSDKKVNKDVLEAFLKIYKGPYILNKDPFNIEIEGSVLEHEIGLSIFDYTLKLVNESPTLVESTNFIELTNLSLDFVRHTRDFYRVDHRLERFIRLSELVPETEFVQDLTVGELMYEVFSYCHPTRYLTSNPGGRTLLEKLKDISEYHISNYLGYVKGRVEEFGVDNINIYWIHQLETIYNTDGSSIKTILDNILLKLPEDD